MYVNVICNKCTNVISWRWGDTVSVCEHCGENLNIRQVKMVEGEVIKLFE